MHALAVVLSFLSYGCVALLQIGSTGSEEFWLAPFECDKQLVQSALKMFYKGAFNFPKLVHVAQLATWNISHGDVKHSICCVRQSKNIQRQRQSARTEVSWGLASQAFVSCQRRQSCCAVFSLSRQSSGVGLETVSAFRLTVCARFFSCVRARACDRGVFWLNTLYSGASRRLFEAQQKSTSADPRSPTHTNRNLSQSGRSVLLTARLKIFMVSSQKKTNNDKKR